MPSLVERVASRHIWAAFIPDKFFKGYEQEFKKLMAEPIKDRVLAQVPFLIHDRVLPLFKRFVAELSDLAPEARQSLADRLSTRENLLSALSEKYAKARRAIASPYPQTSTLDHVLQQIELKVNEKLEKDIPTLGKAFRTELVIDADKVKALASRALKKATPEERAAIDAADDWSTTNLATKYGFYREHIDGAASRLVKKQKVDIEWAPWFERIRDMLAANYNADEQRVTEFEINGMKVIIDDDTVDKDAQAKYVKYLDEAYHRLKAKKLSRAWYGTVYIECKGCGGVNQNTGGGVGGHFNIEKDHVKVFVRPSPFVVELMAHELGHRYWFRQMNQSQRGRFESLVRTHKSEDHGPIIHRRIGKDADKAEAETDFAIKTLTQALDDFLAAPVVALGISSLIQKLRTAVEDSNVWKLPVKLPFSTEVTEALFVDAKKSREALDKHLDGVRRTLDDPSWIIADNATRERKFKERRSQYVSEAKELVAALKLTAFRYHDRTFLLSEEAADEREQKRQEEWDADTREIFPVSDYGKSNIDEAFAEVFAYYVIGNELTRDQVESFKAVLLDKDRMASRVASRWLGGPTARESQNLAAANQ